MIVYCDTSSLVKLYVDEDGSPAVRSLVAEAEVVATSVIAYTEMRSALARLQRSGILDPASTADLRHAFERDWESCLKLEVTEPLCRRAGDLAEAHGLRGFDSLHLASYLQLRREAGAILVEFSAFDQALDTAATRESDRPPPEQIP